MLQKKLQNFVPTSQTSSYNRLEIYNLFASRSVMIIMNGLHEVF